MLLVNSMNSLVLFDSGASHSFVSLKFRKSLDVTIEDLDYPLKVEISDKLIVKESKVYCSCTLKIYDASFPKKILFPFLCEGWI